MFLLILLFPLLCPGYDHVTRADEAKAVDTLLITDNLFRSSDLQTRKKYIELVESVKQNGGDVKVMSTMHVSGERKFIIQ